MGIIRKNKEKEKELRILVLGLDNAGKTTVIKQFKGLPVDDVSPTFGFEISTFEFRDYTVNFWDIGGQKSLRTYWRNYFEETDGIIWVVDSTDPERNKDSECELSKLLVEERLLGAPLLVLANKIDIAENPRPLAFVEILGLDKISNRKWNVMGCSGMTGKGLKTAITWLIEEIICPEFTCGNE